MIEKGFLFYYLNTFRRPGNTFSQLVTDENRLKFGIISVLIPALGYTLFYFMASQAGGSPSTFKPWLALPIEKYFFYDIFLALPGYLLAFIAATSFTYIISKFLKSTVNYDSLLSVIGMSIGVATWSTMAHDLIDSFLGFVRIIDLKEYERLLNQPTFWRYLLLTLFAIYFSWFIVLFTKGIRIATNLSLKKSIFLAIFSTIVFQTVLLIFIR